MANPNFINEIKQCKELFETSDFYAVLGLNGKNPKQFGYKEIKKGFQKACKEFHPDRVQNALRSRLSASDIGLSTRRFQLLTTIFSILSDWKKKAAYDDIRATQTDEEYGGGDYQRNIPTGENFDRFFDIEVRVTCPANDIDPDLKFRSFERMNLPKDLLNNIRAVYDIPMPIQQRAIPHIFNGRDIVGWSPTGSGKTAAYTIPLLTFMINGEDLGRVPSFPAAPLALILLPTRELALQVTTDFEKISNGFNAKMVAVVGGSPRRSCYDQRYQLRAGCDILVATPGRLKAFIEGNLVTLSHIKFFVLDEADLMLDLGFGREVRKIMALEAMPPKTERTSLLFSATFPRAVQNLADDVLETNYVHIKVDASKDSASADRPFVVNSDITQKIINVPEYDKLEKLVDILKSELKGSLQGNKWTKKILVFVERKTDANDMVEQLLKQFEIAAGAMNAYLEQGQRESSLDQFKNGDIPVLVATSVAARGLDIKGVDLVINYQLPIGYDKKGNARMTPQQRIAFYVQRIGRTGRVGYRGRAMTFFDPESRDREIGKELLKVLEAAQQEVPGWFQLGFGGGSRNFIEE